MLHPVPPTPQLMGPGLYGPLPWDAGYLMKRSITPTAAICGRCSQTTFMMAISAADLPYFVHPPGPLPSSLLCPDAEEALVCEGCLPSDVEASLRV